MLFLTLEFKIYCYLSRKTTQTQQNKESSARPVPMEIIKNSSRLPIKSGCSDGVICDGRSQPGKLKLSPAPHELNSQEAGKAEGIWIWLLDITNKLSLTTPINIRGSRNWISGSQNLAESWCRRQIQQDTGCNDGPLVLLYLMGPLRNGKSLFLTHNNFILMKAHLRTVKASALCPLAEDLTPAAGAEFTACVVPYVTMVTHRALVQAAPLGSHTLLAALTGTLDFSLTLQGNTSSKLNWGQLSLFTNLPPVSACFRPIHHFLYQRAAGF